MKQLIYSPQPKATVDEVMQVLKIFTVTTMPFADNNTVIGVYDELPAEAKRHFKIVDDGDRKL
jgi:hypothetical protein